jgi:segregation and condensation protein B
MSDGSDLAEVFAAARAADARAKEESAGVVVAEPVDAPSGEPEALGEPVQAPDDGPEPEGLGEPAEAPDDGPEPELARTVEALLFLSDDPLNVAELADATEAGEGAVQAAIALLGEQYAPGRRGIMLRELGGGWTLASDPATEDAARRLFSRPRLSTLTPAQAETLAIVAYLQPVSRPEITRIRGVSGDSASSTLLERGLIEESGRSEFGAALYRTTTQFLKLFGLRDIEELPDVARWDPSPEEQAELRDRLLRAGEGRSGGAPAESLDESEASPAPAPDSPQAAERQGQEPAES